MTENTFSLPTPTLPPRRDRSAKHSEAAAALLVFILAVVVYLNSLPGAFIIDDHSIVRDNQFVRTFAVMDILTSDYWRTNFSISQTSGLYRPLTVLSFALNYHLLGPDALPFHAVNIILHAFASMLFFLFARTIRLPKPYAFFAAALFAVQPIHCEVVDTIVGRSELLVASFVFLALWVDAKSATTRRWIVPLCLAGALLSKENGIVLIVLLPLASAFRGGSITHDMRERWRFYLILVSMSAIWLLGRAVYFPQQPVKALVTDNPLSVLPFAPRFVNALQTQLIYIQKILMPGNYGLLYGKDDITLLNFVSLPSLGLIALFALLVVLSILQWRKGSIVGFALPFYAISAAPTANIFVIVAVLMAERLAYLPSAAVALLLSALLKNVITFGAVQYNFGKFCKITATILCVIYLAWMSSATLIRNPDFSDQIVVLTKVVSMNPRNSRSLTWLGNAYIDAGRNAEGEEYYLAAIENDPTYPDQWLALAELYAKIGNLEASRTIAEKGLIYNADPALRVLIAYVYAELGNPGIALRHLSTVSPYMQDDYNYVFTKAIIADEVGDLNNAEIFYKKSMIIAEAINIEKKEEGYYRLADVYLRKNEPAHAEEVAREALSRWNAPEIRNQLGISLAQQGKYNEAIVQFRMAVEQYPGKAIYRQNLDRAISDSKQ